MRFTISETAKYTGVSVRTLHYYDEIGLLTPSEVVADTGYRYYDEDAVSKLQQILFYRELDFTLKDIVKIINSENYDKMEALRNQKELLLLKKKRLSKLINLIDNNLKGENNMSFDEFDENEIIQAKEKYAKEVKEKWGSSDEYKESIKRQKGYSKEKWEEMNKKQKMIFEKLSSLVGESPENSKVQEIVKEWQDFITEYYYKCTDEILAGLGKMYVADERFKNNINKSGEGTAELLSDAIQSYCTK